MKFKERRRHGHHLFPKQHILQKQAILDEKEEGDSSPPYLMEWDKRGFPNRQ